MAGSLIETLSGDFDPSQYKDSYREALQAVIEAKIEGREIVQPTDARQPVVQPGRRQARRRLVQSPAHDARRDGSHRSDDREHDQHLDQGHRVIVSRGPPAARRPLRTPVPPPDRGRMPRIGAATPVGGRKAGRGEEGVRRAGAAGWSGPRRTRRGPRG